MALTKIVTRFENPCADCGRTVKVGWTAYFDVQGTKKLLYCKPCGEKRLSGKKVIEQEVPLEEALELSKVISQLEYMSGLLLTNHQLITEMADILRKPEPKPKAKSK